MRIYWKLRAFERNFVRSIKKIKILENAKIRLGGISLPFFNMSFNEQKYIVNKLKSALEKKF